MPIALNRTKGVSATTRDVKLAEEANFAALSQIAEAIANMFEQVIEQQPAAVGG